MINFKDKKIYENKKREFKKFLDKKLTNPSERDTRMEMLEAENDTGGLVMDMTSYADGSPIDLDFGGGSDFGGMGDLFGGGFGDSSGDKHSKFTEYVDVRKHEQDRGWKNILFAPGFLVYYVIMLLVYSYPKDKDDWRDILTALNKITMVTTFISLALWLFDFKFIFSLQFQTIASAIMLLISYSLLKFVIGEKEETAQSDDLFGGGFGDDSMGGFGFTNEDDSMGYGIAGGYDDAITMNNDFLGRDTNDYIEEEVDIPSDKKLLPPSTIDISDNETFAMDLLDTFVKGKKFMGKEIQERRKLLDSFAPYIVTNDKDFGSWKIIREGTLEYQQIAFTLFLGLGQIKQQFLKDEEFMVVNEIKVNPLMYKITVELPSYFTEPSVKGKLDEIKNYLRKDGEDIDVAVNMEYYRGTFTFKFLRLDNKNLISLGDILRFYDEDKGSSPIEEFSNPKKGLPMLLGLRNNEYPYIVDLEENTSGVIVGGSGSGKSWLTFLVMFNFVLSNDYNNAQFLIFDKKNAPFWNQFAKFPHVLGYHTDVRSYVEKFREIYTEVDRRKALLNQLGSENVKSLRSELRMANKYEELKQIPLLTIVIDEITSTMMELKTMAESESDDFTKEEYDEFRAILSKITQEGRSLGVRLICIGQRAIDNSIPKNVMANSSFKFAMKMDVNGDFELMLDKDVNNMQKPAGAGLGLSKTFGVDGVHPIKTLTVGGSNENQILKLIRVLALDWNRRSLGIDNLLNPPEGMNLNLCYNRDKFVKESFNDLREGLILDKNTYSEEAKVPENIILSALNGVVLDTPTKSDVKDDKKGDKKGKNSAGLSAEELEEIKRADTMRMQAKLRQSANSRNTDSEDNDSTTNRNVADDIQTPYVVDNPNNISSRLINLADEDVEDEYEMIDETIDEAYKKPTSNLDNLFVTDDDEDVLDILSQKRKSTVNTIVDEDDDEEEFDFIPKRPSPLDIIDDEDDDEEEFDFLPKRPSPLDIIDEDDDDDEEFDFLPKNSEPIVVEEPTRRVVEKPIEPIKPIVTEQPTLQVDNSKILNKLQERKQGQVTMNFNNQTVQNTAPKTNLPIKEYVVQYGEKDGVVNRKILKSELEAVYSSDKIQRAIDMMLLLETGDYYVIML